MKIKPEDIRKIAKAFYDLTVNKYRLYVIKENGYYDMDLMIEPEDGIDELVEKSLLAALNSVLSEHKPEILPPTKAVKLITYEGDAKINPCANDILWADSTKREQ